MDRTLKPGTPVRSAFTGRKGTVVESLDDEWARKGLVRVRWVDHWSPTSPGAICYPDTLETDEEPTPQKKAVPRVPVPSSGVVMDDEVWVNGRRKRRC